MISVIVPIYNVEKYIRECIESIINQVYCDLEIILVDDGSTDNSGIICDDYAKFDPRIRVIHKSNGGLSDARNAGMKMAHGDWIGFVDGDDFIHPHMYAELYQCINKTNVNMAVCSFLPSEYYRKNWEYDKTNEIKIFNSAEALCNLHTLMVSACNKIYNKNIFKTIQYPVAKLHEDEAVIHRLIYQCDKIAFIKEQLYGRRIREGSIMTSELNEKRICDAMDALTDRVNFVYDMNWKESQKAVLNQLGEQVLVYYSLLEDRKIPGYRELQSMLRNKLMQLEKNKKRELRMEYRVFCKWPHCYQKCKKIKHALTGGKK